ncbi:uncharacterized protein LOC108099443 [Drosophila ficusphila]|uniref:uncharacterized protein LOC108099443 n=1 Tax=Drosophila ficusphila TaxID=30025 RepID=UPI0007E5F2E8|nr:uncharacterized protein LOC108099443 [Drosophila ficusphila]
MRSVLVVLLICAVALAQASTIPGSDEYSAQSWTRPHSQLWACDVCNYPEAYVLMHKVDKRLERIENEDTKSRIKDYAVGQLRLCVLDGQMDMHCVRRSIGYTMSFIHHQKSQANSY